MKTSGTLALFLLFLTGCLPSGEKSELSFKAAMRSPACSGGTSSASSKAAFEKTVYPLVHGNTCVSCHNSTSGKPQAPYFADHNSSTAFDAITLSKKIDLGNPSDSRIAIKVVEDNHNCFGGDCAATSAQLLAAVKEWAKLAPASDCGGSEVTTAELPVPSETSPAQTEWGTLILQAEQPRWASEVQSGRFTQTMDSQASDGHFLWFTAPEANPNGATRNFNVNFGQFGNCREFNDVVDISDPTTRALKLIQSKVHNPSENIMSGSNIVNDGYVPKIARFKYNIIRPDKRVEYANMLRTGDSSNLDSVYLKNGNPLTVPKVLGNALAGLGGQAVSEAPSVFALPKFVHHSSVFQPNGNFKPGKELHEIFQDPFDETDSSIRENLADPEFSPLKKYIFYSALKGFTANVHYNAGAPRAVASLPYGNFLNSSVQALMSRDVSVTYQCPPAQNCAADPTLLKFTVSASGPVLTQSNALDCYTLSGSNFVAALPAECESGNPNYFHLIDLYVRPTLDNSAVAARSLNTYQESTSPGAHVDLETFNSGASQVFLNDMASSEEAQDFLFVSGSNTLNPADDLANYSNTLFPVIRGASCITCHGVNQNPQFAVSSNAASLASIKAAGLVNFSNPSNSFRDANNWEMVHNCGSPAQCATLKNQIIGAISDWKALNDQATQQSSAEKFKNYSRNERLPGRVKYKVKVTEAGQYNIWVRIKNSINAAQRLNYRILQNGTTPVQFKIGSNGNLQANPCFNWNVTTTQDTWDWIAPGRSAEYAQIDQKGFILFDSNKNPLPLADQRHYYSLTPGEYTIDIIGLTQGLKIDALALNKVNNPSDWRDRLEFQPDRRAVDGGHVNDLKRHVLTYDISKQLKLENGKKAFFEIEVKMGPDGKNFIFKNPRFRTSSRDFNIAVRSIKVFINGQWSAPDATYNKIDLVVGDNKVITFAPLLAIVVGRSDRISFGFEKLSVTKENLSPLYPKGEPVNPLSSQHCNDIQYFIKNVKPILKEVKVMLNSEWSDYAARFPGAPRQGFTSPQAYNCISCHDQTHPYFKMSTFTNDDEFCREALSRVDFDTYKQSLVVRGINGTGNHPKFVFVEEFQKDANGLFRTHNNGSDFNSGLYKGGTSDIASKPVAGPMVLWTMSDITTDPVYAGLSGGQQATARSKAGLPKVIQNVLIPEIVTTYVWYDEDIHRDLIYNPQNPLQLDNTMGAFDKITAVGGTINANRQQGPRIYTLGGYSGAVPLAANLGDRNSGIAIKGLTKQYISGGPQGFDPATLDWDASTPAQDSEAVMNNKWEALRAYYRETVIEWIRREDALRDK